MLLQDIHLDASCFEGGHCLPPEVQQGVQQTYDHPRHAAADQG